MLLEFFDKQGNLLFTLAAYTAYWRNPYRVNVTVVSPALLGIPGVNPNVTRRFELVGEAATGPLIEGSYVLDDRWSIGFWYNPVSDRSRQRVVQIADVVLGMELERNADLADVHVVYRTPKGLSTQIGYYYEGGRVRIRESNLQNPPTFRTQSARYRFTSWNVWVTQRLDVQIGRQLITPFLSAGYHSSSDLNRAVSILVGAGVTFSERLSFSGSVWWFDLDRAATRVTAGLEYRF